MRSNQNARARRSDRCVRRPFDRERACDGRGAGTRFPARGERARPLVARNEVFQLVVRAVRETTTVPALVARAIKLVDGLARTRRETVEKSQIASSTPSPTRLARFVISPSTLGVFIHYRCARLLLRLAKRNVGLDYRVRATEASRGSTATKAFDSGAAIIAGEALTDRDVSEAAAALARPGTRPRRRQIHRAPSSGSGAPPRPTRSFPLRLRPRRPPAPGPGARRCGPPRQARLRASSPGAPPHLCAPPPPRPSSGTGPRPPTPAPLRPRPRASTRRRGTTTAPAPPA